MIFGDGGGYNTPGIIKYPFRRMTAENPESVYACINYDEAACPAGIGAQPICMACDAGEVIAALTER